MSEKSTYLTRPRKMLLGVLALVGVAGIGIGTKGMVDSFDSKPAHVEFPAMEEFNSGDYLSKNTLNIVGALGGAVLLVTTGLLVDGLSSKQNSEPVEDNQLASQ